MNIITLLKREGYVVIVLMIGTLGIVEGLRVDSNVQSASFLSGPGGYLTIIGIFLLLFGFIDIMRQLVRRGRTHTAVPTNASEDKVGKGLS